MENNWLHLRMMEGAQSGVARQVPPTTVRDSVRALTHQRKVRRAQAEPAKQQTQPQPVPENRQK